MKAERQREELCCHSQGRPGTTRSYPPRGPGFAPWGGVALPTPWLQTSGPLEPCLHNLCCFKPLGLCWSATEAPGDTHAPWRWQCHREVPGSSGNISPQAAWGRPRRYVSDVCQIPPAPQAEKVSRFWLSFSIPVSRMHPSGATRLSLSPPCRSLFLTKRAGLASEASASKCTTLFSYLFIKTVLAPHFKKYYKVSLFKIDVHQGSQQHHSWQSEGGNDARARQQMNGWTEVWAVPTTECHPAVKGQKGSYRLQCGWTLRHQLDARGQTFADSTYSRY